MKDLYQTNMILTTVSFLGLIVALLIGGVVR